MKVQDIGEFGLIELVAGMVSGSGISGNVILGIGDDAACWHGDAPIELGTTDTLVQDVHFTPDTTTWGELGWRAVAINLSDIAAMGGVPRYALVSLAIPGDTDVESVAELYQGMLELGRRFDVSIVGGDIVSSPLIVIGVTVLGSIKDPDSILTRSGAVSGERIAVTGYLGSSGGGLRMLREGLWFDQETASLLREAHLRPQPRVVEGQALAEAGVRACIDISDGLISDLKKLCQASKVGARIEAERVPIRPLLRSAFPTSYLELALSGGEDYELLFTASEEVVTGLREILSSPVAVIGEIIEDEPGRVAVFDRDGKEIGLDSEGWEHFAQAHK